MYRAILMYQKVNPSLRKTHYKRDGETEKDRNDQGRKILLSSQNLMADLWGLKPVRPNPKVSEYVLENVGAAVSFSKESQAHLKR